MMAAVVMQIQKPRSFPLHHLTDNQSSVTELLPTKRSNTLRKFDNKDSRHDKLFT